MFNDNNGYVYDENGNRIFFEAAVTLMDDEIREEVHRDIVPCTEQEFYDEYVKRHMDAFGEEFIVN